MAKLVQGQGSLRKRIREESQGETEAAVGSAESTADHDSTLQPKKRTRKPKPGKAVAKIQKNSDDDVDNVVYLGHVPSGFNEPEIRSFFSQFGNVRRIKLFRSKKTGNSKGYAFVQFESMSIAVVAAEAMDGYMFGDRKLVAHVVQKDKCHSGMFLPYKEKPAAPTKIVKDEPIEKTVAREYSKVLRSEKKKMNRIKASGIDF